MPTPQVTNVLSTLAHGRESLRQISVFEIFPWIGSLARMNNPLLFDSCRSLQTLSPIPRFRPFPLDYVVLPLVLGIA